MYCDLTRGMKKSRDDQIALLKSSSPKKEMYFVINTRYEIQGNYKTVAGRLLCNHQVHSGKNL
jgi:hypothetical protein